MTDHAGSLQPDLSNPLSRSYWDGLQEGKLKLQHCTDCGNRWLPARHECPRCLSDSWTWSEACGEASLISWVVYHRAYHPSFANQIPYAVAIVETAEGARLLARLEGRDDLENFRIGEALRLQISRAGDLALPTFRPERADVF